MSTAVIVQEQIAATETAVFPPRTPRVCPCGNIIAPTNTQPRCRRCIAEAEEEARQTAAYKRRRGPKERNTGISVKATIAFANRLKNAAGQAFHVNPAMIGQREAGHPGKAAMQAVEYILKNDTAVSFCTAARITAQGRRRHHTTVIHSRDIVEQRILTDPYWAHQVAAIREAAPSMPERLLDQDPGDSLFREMHAAAAELLARHFNGRVPRERKRAGTLATWVTVYAVHVIHRRPAWDAMAFAHLPYCKRMGVIRNKITRNAALREIAGKIAEAYPPPWPIAE